MKLVTILARELWEWPDTAKCYAQDYDGYAHPYTGIDLKNESGAWECDYDVIDLSDRAISFQVNPSEDHTTAIITREMWQAERERLEDEEDAAVVRERKGEPTVPVWLGDGLPPIGATVLNRHGEERRVVAHDGDTIVCAAGAGHYRGYTKSEQLELRPIKSDRDRWIEAADKCIGHGLSLHGKLAAIYDAGLAKMPEVE